MKNHFLYLTCTLIWGSTWLAITFQLNGTSPIVSVFYRFLVSSAILLATCFALKIPLKFSTKKHSWFLAQGVFLFSANYMLTYAAEGMISSGLVALTFTLLLYFNILGAHFFYKTPINRNVVFGSLVGGFGILLIFLPEILNFQPGSRSVVGLAIGIISTLFASAGNLVSYQNRANKVPIIASNTFGMFYGSLFSLAIALVLQESFETHWTEQYIISLIYLSVFGSVIAFGAYLSLIDRIGAEKAAYTSIINPIIALILSSLFENFHWSATVISGAALCVFGNIITLYKRSRRLGGLH